MQIKSTKNYLPTFTGLVLSLGLFCFILFSLINYGSEYDVKIILISLAVVIFWLAAFVFNIKKYDFKIGEILISFVLLTILCLYLVNVLWITGYLSLDPYLKIQTGLSHIDTMFHSTLARSYIEYGRPVLLTNGISSISYHMGSHFIFGLISILFGINIVFVYNFIYPIFFVPLFFYIIQKCALSVKAYLNISSENKIKNIDLFFIMLLFIPIMSIDVYHNSGIFLTNYFTSESFLIANSLMLLFIILAVYINKKAYFNKSAIKLVWLIVAIPTIITAISYIKMSTGAIMLSGVMYFVFRKHTLNIKYWILNAWYAAVFFISYFTLFNDGSESPYGSYTPIQLFAFIKAYVKDGNILFHLTYLSIFAFIVAVYTMRNVKTIKQLITDNKFALEETVIVMTIASFMPGFIFDIIGASALFFIMVPCVVGLVLFVAHNLPRKIYQMCVKLFVPKIATYVVILAVLLVFITNAGVPNTAINVNRQVYQATGYNDDDYNLYKTQILSGNIFGGVAGIFNMHLTQNKVIDSSIISNLIYLDSLPLEQKEQSVVYIDETCELWDVYKDSDNLMFTLSGYTGMQTYNMLFFNEQGLPTYHNGTQSTRYRYGYGINKMPIDEYMMTQEEAVQKAQEEGYAYVYIYANDTIEEIVL